MAYMKPILLGNNFDFNLLEKCYKVECWDDFTFNIIYSPLCHSNYKHENLTWCIKSPTFEDELLKEYREYDETPEGEKMMNLYGSYIDVPTKIIITLINKHGGYKEVIKNVDALIESHPELYLGYVKIEI
jgi:hypothetical protein